MMATKELIDAIRTGTEETMALVFAGVADKKILRLLHCESPGRAAAVTAASAAMLEIAEAIVAARDKPDANAPHDAKGRLIELRDFDATEVVGVQIGTLGHKLWICIDGIAVLRVNSPKIELEDMREPKECPPESHT